MTKDDKDRELVGKVWLETATLVIADAMFLQGDSVDEPGQIMVNDREAVKVQGEIVEGLPSDGFYNVFVDRSNEIGWAILIEPDYEYHKITLEGAKFEEHTGRWVL